MKTSNQNFTELKQLLKLKRHEIPPPGYFNNFAGEVISRLRAGEAEAAQGLAERLQEQVPWLADLLRIFETRPGLIGGFATSLCLLLLFGVVLADRPDSPSSATVASSQSASDAAPLTSVVPAMASADNTGISISTSPANSVMALQPSLQPAASLFGQTPNPLFQSASFMPAGQ